MSLWQKAGLIGAAVGLILGCVGAALFLGVMMVGLGGTPTGEDTTAFLVSLGLGAIPVGIVGALVLGVGGVLVGVLIDSTRGGSQPQLDPASGSVTPGGQPSEGQVVPAVFPHSKFGKISVILSPIAIIVCMVSSAIRPTIDEMASQKLVGGLAMAGLALYCLLSFGGLGFGIAGLFERDRQRPLAIAGIVIHGLFSLVSLFVLVIIVVNVSAMMGLDY